MKKGKAKIQCPSCRAVRLEHLNSTDETHFEIWEEWFEEMQRRSEARDNVPYWLEEVYRRKQWGNEGKGRDEIDALWDEIEDTRDTMI